MHRPTAAATITRRPGRHLVAALTLLMMVIGSALLRADRQRTSKRAKAAATASGLGGGSAGKSAKKHALKWKTRTTQCTSRTPWEYRTKISCLWRLEIDCWDGIGYEYTTDELLFRVFSDGKLRAEKSVVPDCDKYSDASIDFSLEMTYLVGYVEIMNPGGDALFIDEMRLSQREQVAENSRYRYIYKTHWGQDGGKGYCLSSQPGDASSFGSQVDGCHYGIRFKIDWGDDNSVWATASETNLSASAHAISKPEPRWLPDLVELMDYPVPGVYYAKEDGRCRYGESRKIYGWGRVCLLRELEPPVAGYLMTRSVLFYPASYGVPGLCKDQFGPGLWIGLGLINAGFDPRFNCAVKLPDSLLKDIGK